MNKIVFEYLHCGRKIRYKSESRAQKVADQQNKRGKGGKVLPYHCKVCDGWHNGHETSTTKVLFLKTSYRHVPIA